MGAIPEIYQSWNPKHINTDGQMVLWLNPNSIGVTSGVVATWPDDGNLGYDATQGTGADKPCYSAETVYGEVSVDFEDADTEFMTCGAIPELEVGEGDFGWAIAVRFDVLVAAVQGVFHKAHVTSGGSAGAGITFRQMSSGASLYNERRSQAGGGGTKALFNVGDAGQEVDVWHIYSSTRTGGVLSCWVDGVLADSNAADGSDNYNINYLSGSPIELIIGGTGPSGTDKSLDGTLGDFVMVSGTVGEAARQKLEGFIAHKWNGVRGSSDPLLVALLPSTHPYKTIKPSGSVGITMGDGLTGTASSLSGECAGGLGWFTNEIQSVSRR